LLKIRRSLNRSGFSSPAHINRMHRLLDVGRRRISLELPGGTLQMNANIPNDVRTSNPEQRPLHYIRAFPGLLQDRCGTWTATGHASSFRSQKTIMHKMARRIMKDLQRRESTHFLDR
jgi:hypothetical protein